MMHYSEDRLIEFAELQRMLGGGISRMSIDRWEKAGQFPKRRMLGTDRVAWLYSEVVNWIKTRPTRDEMK